MCGWSSALGLGLLPTVDRDLEDDALAAERKVLGDEHPRVPSLADLSPQAELFEVHPGLGEFNRRHRETGRLAEQAMVPELRLDRILPDRVLIAERISVDLVAALLS